MTITAAELMSHPVTTVMPQTSVGEIADVLARTGYSALPVVYPDGRLAGIVSEQDVIKPFRKSAQEKRDRWLTLLAEGEALSQAFLDHIRVDTRTAEEIMVRNVRTATEHTTLPELAELMVDHGLKRLPILRDGQVVGIVSRLDLVRAIARAPAMQP